MTAADHPGGNTPPAWGHHRAILGTPRSLVPSPHPGRHPGTAPRPPAPAPRWTTVTGPTWDGAPSSTIHTTYYRYLLNYPSPSSLSGEREERTARG